jgi:hypothetical protein
MENTPFPIVSIFLGSYSFPWERVYRAVLRNGRLFAYCIATDVHATNTKLLKSYALKQLKVMDSVVRNIQTSVTSA